MPKVIFKALVKELQEHCQLKATKKVSANEQVAMYLYFAGHHASSFNLQERFQQSSETVPRHLHRVQDAILRLATTYVHTDPTRGLYTTTYCRIAVDGTHIPVSVPAKDVKAYQGRKGITQNVLAACDFIMMFTYVLAEWEGSAGDGRIYADALQKGYAISGLKFDIMDAGFALRLKSLTPYRDAMYPLEYGQGSKKPRTKEELFNFRHVMLRNVVEYSIGFQVDMVLALCTVHNFIRLHGCTNDIYEQEATQELRARNRKPMQPNDQPHHHPDLESTEAKAWRDQIVTEMWEQYQIICNRRRIKR
ncbi:hypothetical protein AaE_015960 [Aphanomyces astaci]|uniref:Uncharacterized protein n=1 Tax=Aphanomyces astaci TaxID=112090 RepID=A0A6A4YUL5_APHAT|nr:hypothetical protein AaE_015960 [Aphanomyces astaci]